MKNKTILFIGLIFASAGVLAADKTLPDKSIYHLSSIWKNEMAQEIPISSLKGEVHILAMVFTSCQYACPMIIADIKKIIDALPDKVAKQVHVSLFSFDPKNDTPKQLRKYRKKESLGENWTMYTSNDDDVRDLAAVLETVKYKKMPNGMYTHSNVIYIVNREGVVVHQQMGLNAKQDDTVEILISLIK